MKFINIVIKTRTALFVAVTLLFAQSVFAADAAIKINVDNIVRAETAAQFDRVTVAMGMPVNVQ